MSDDIPSDPPPIEPMSDMSWARIERGLLARLDGQATAPVERPPSRRWMYLAIPAAAAAAAIVLVLAMQGGEPARAPQIADTADLPLEPSRVVSGDSPSTVSFGDAHLTMSAKTAIVMSHEGGSPSVLLERGTLDLAVAPRDNRPPFVVRAGDTVVRVVGTRFQVARYEERVTVKVEHGIVDVQFRGNTVRVEQGQAWASEQPETVTSKVASAEPLVVAPPAADQPAVDQPVVDQPVVDQPAVADRPASGQPKAEKPRAEKPAVTKPVTQPQVAKPAQPAVTAEPATSLPVRKIDLEQLKFEKMQSLEVRDPQGAITGYLELSKGNGRWAANALFAAGRLAADRGDPRAKTFLTIYLRRFPTDDNVIPARTLLKRLEGE